MLSQMRRSRGFGAAAFEIDDGHDLQMLLVPAVRDVTALARTARLVKKYPQLLNLRGRIGTTPARRDRRQRTLAFKRQVAQIAARNPQPLRDLARREVAERLFGNRRKEL